VHRLCNKTELQRIVMLSYPQPTGMSNEPGGCVVGPTRSFKVFAHKASFDGFSLWGKPGSKENRPNFWLC